MSGLFRGLSGGSRPAATPSYTGLQIQTAVSALPIPVVWGQSKLAPNVIWYNGFIAIPASSGGGGKGGIFASGSSNVTSYDYRASVILALCEGPIIGINQIWRDQSDYTLAGLGLTLFPGSTPQTVWGYLTATYPSQALAYQGTAYVAAASYDLSGAATIDNHNFEVQGFRHGSGANGIDADPALVVYDFLTNAQFGVGFPSGSIDTTTLFGAGGDASYQTYCAGTGLCLSPALTDQETASSILDRWLKLTNTAAVWSGDRLKFIPYGDTATVAGTVSATTVTVDVPPAGSFITPVPTIYVCPPAKFAADGGVKYSLSGVALVYIGTAAPSAAGQYGISPAGTYLFAAADENNSVAVSFSSTTGASFVPNVTPIYDLTDDDFVGEANADPVQITRSDPYGAYNVWRLEVAERANAYNLTTVESRDQNAIELLGQDGVSGMRIAPTVTAHEICDPGVALISAQLMLQRAVYIRNSYRFRLSWEYCLLDPMDLVTVTDSILGLTKAPIRITEIEEDENGYLEVTADEFPLGTASATLYATQATTNNPINRNYTPATVNTPVIYEPPSAYSATAELLIGASGGSGGVADPLWGGCFVYISLDGTTYQNIGAILSPSRQGAVTAVLPAFSGTNPDTADSLTVNLSESGGVLESASNIAAQLGQTLCLVDSELLAYTTATLVSGNSYKLTGLYRGLYGTAAAAHSVGAQFLRIDNAVFAFDLPAQFVNQEIYIKLASFNAFGGAPQDLSTCTAFSYVPAGLSSHPLATALNIGTNEDLGNWTETVGTRDDFGVPWTTTIAISLDLGAWH